MVMMDGEMHGDTRGHRLCYCKLKTHFALCTDCRCVSFSVENEGL